MYSLIFARMPDGSYKIADHNDELLRTLAELFLDKTSRSELKAKLESLEGLKVGESLKLHTNPKLQFTVIQDDINKLIIKLHDYSDLKTHFYQIDIKNDTLLNLIDKWLDLVEQNGQDIIFTNDTGTFNLSFTQ